MPAEEVARQLVLGGQLQEEPSPVLVADMLDALYGHSAHIFQGVEIYGGKPILYDTGDFIDDYAVHPKLRNDWSFLFKVSVEGSEFRRLELFPVTLHYTRVQRAKGKEREAILDRMERLSGEMGTAFVRREGRLVFERG
jgi:poly-gamma-glutamate capsule biosynthesis protein CapA/YwtB (metallophosphatase superfamily)